MTLCIDTRDELRLIPLDDVAYLKADGNYTDFHFNDGRILSEASYLYEVHDLILRHYPQAPFLRLGRSIVVNASQVQHIHVQTQLLSFQSSAIPSIRLSKRLLKELKAHILQHFAASPLASPL